MSAGDNLAAVVFDLLVVIPAGNLLLGHPSQPSQTTHSKELAQSIQNKELIKSNFINTLRPKKP
jgi:hypothetical protein